MTTSALIPCGGLRTDVSLVAAPLGSLRRADNVVIDAPGVASARPNFTELVVKSNTSYVPRAITVFRREPIYVTWDGSAWRVETSSGTVTGDATPADYSTSATQFAQARKNLYLATTAGVKKLATPGAAALGTAGMHAPGHALIAFVGTTPTWIADGELVGYRVLFRKQDLTNDFETKSAPTPWTYLQNATGSPASVEVTIPLPSYVAAGDLIEVYRSAIASAGTPSDELRLSVRHVVTSGDVSAGYVVIADTTPVGLLGESLYTNSTREGIEGANLPPPRCIALEAWRDSLWFGNVRLPQTLRVDLVERWAPPDTYTGAVDTGSPLLSGASDPTLVHVRVGQRVMESSGAFAPGTTVLAVGPGNQVTLSTNSLSTSAAVAVSFADVITIAGEQYYASEDYPSTSLVDRTFRVWNVGGNAAASAFATARELAFLVSALSSAIVARSYEDTSVGVFDRTGRMVFQRTDPSSDTTFTFSSTAPAASFTAPDGSYTSASESRPNRLYFSKPGEPEHVRDLDWMPVGSEDADILRAVGLPGALLVFKRDGVFRVSGTWPFFSVDALVPGLRLVRPEALDVLEDVVYAWTDRGLLELTDNGVARNLSDGAIREQLAPYLNLQSGISAIHGTFVACWRDRGLIVLGVGETSSWAERLFVFDLSTRSWSRWVFTSARAWRAACYDIEGRRLLHSIRTGWEVRASLSGDARGYDREHEIDDWTITGTPATSITVLDDDIDTEGAWVPAVGDWVSYGEEWRRVLAVAAFSPEMERIGWTFTIDAAFTGSGIKAAYEGAPAALEWMAQTMGGPSRGGLVREMHLQLDASRWTSSGDARARISAGAASDVVDTATLTATPLFTEVRSRPLRFGMPRAVARSAHLYPYLAINERFRWRALGICLVGEGVSERVRK